MVYGNTYTGLASEVLESLTMILVGIQFRVSRIAHRVGLRVGSVQNKQGQDFLSPRAASQMLPV